MRPARKLLVLGATLAAVGVALFVLLLDGGDDGGRRDRLSVPRLLWTQGDTQAYEFDVDVDALVTENRIPRHRIRQRCSGTLHMRVFGGADPVLVGFQVEGMRIQVEGDSAQEPIGPVDGPPFWVRFGRDGEVRETVFHADTSAGTRQILEETVRTFQCVMRGGSRVRWSTEEAHSTGDYAADYFVTPKGRIRKSKSAYLADEISVERSSAMFVLSETSWLASAALRDRLVIRPENGSHVLTKTTASLEAISGVPLQTPDALLATYGDALFAVERHRTAPAPRPKDTGPKYSVEDVRRAVVALNASDGTHTKLVRKLSDQIASDPEFVAVVLEALEAERTSDGTAAAMINALAMANTEEADAGLAEVVRNRDRRHVNRRRATIALGFSWKPNDSVMNTLWETSEDRSSEDATDLSNTALLAIGTTTGTLGKLRSPSYAGNRERLIRRMEGAADQGEREIALMALGNTRDSSVAGAISTQLDAPEYGVRKASAYALRLMKDPVVAERLADRLDVEEDIAVRHEIAASLNRLDVATPRTLALAHARARIEKDESTRYELVALLVRHTAAVRGWRGTFQELLRVENSSRIRKQLGRALFVQRKTQRRD